MSDSTNPGTADRDPNFLLSTMDAKIWADEFCKRHFTADHGMMLSWFACAIMTGFDEATRRAALQKPEVSQDAITTIIG